MSFVVTDHPTLDLEVRAVQRALGVDDDGDFGDLSWAALLAKLDVHVSQIRWGVSVPGGPAATAAFEKKLGRPVRNNREYYQATGNPVDTLKADDAAGRRTLLSMKPEGGVSGWKKPPSPSFLDRWAKAINLYGADDDVYVNHEPENDGGRPEDFQRWADQTIAGLRSRITTPGVRLGICLMAFTVNPASDRDPYAYIPPNAEVLAWDGYGALGDNPKTATRTPAQVFDPCAAVNRKLRIPMVVAECGQQAWRGDQPDWIRQLLAYAPTVADVLTDVAYWSSGDMTLNALSLAEYRKAFA